MDHLLLLQSDRPTSYGLIGCQKAKVKACQ